MSKYHQPGYQDHDEKGPNEKAPQGKPRSREIIGPRPIQMPGKRTLSRCAQCGVVLGPMSEPLGQCPKCGFELHSCKQCTHFDPASRFECRQPVPERVARKDAGNECTFFSLRVSVERETSTGGATRSDDARRAFENLFKK